MAKAVGIGGVFFRAQDATALADWYAQVLGLGAAEQGSVTFTEPAGAASVFAVFPSDTPYFGSSGQAFMVNLRVDDLEGCLSAVSAGGGQVDPERMDEPYGRFGWFTDPAGNRVELWEPKGP